MAEEEKKEVKEEKPQGNKPKPPTSSRISLIQKL